MMSIKRVHGFFGNTTIHNPTESLPPTKQEAKERLSQLLEKMKDSFHPSATEIIQNWIASHDLTTDEANQDTSIILCFRLIDLLDQVILAQKDLNIKEEILKLQLDCVNALKSMLLEGVDADQFIEQKKKENYKISKIHMLAQKKHIKKTLFQDKQYSDGNYGIMSNPVTSNSKFLKIKHAKPIRQIQETSEQKTKTLESFLETASKTMHSEAQADLEPQGCLNNNKKITKLSSHSLLHDSSSSEEK